MINPGERQPDLPGDDAPPGGDVPQTGGDPVIDLNALPEYPKLDLAEQNDLFDKLEKAAEGGVAVQAINERGGRSDLDGNIAIYLLRRVKVIKDRTPIYYVRHEDINGSGLDKHPEVKLFLDISQTPESVDTILKSSDSAEEKKARLKAREARLAFRSGLASELITTVEEGGVGRIYFEHHTPELTQESVSTTMKVYAYLRALGKVPTPEDPDPQRAEVGRRLWNLVLFTNAQDLKNYYGSERFNIEQTVMNAFGWLQAPVTNPDGTLWRNPKQPNQRDWWGRYDPNRKDTEGIVVGYRPEFMKMMGLTGNDPTTQLDFNQLRSIGIKNPELVVAKIKEGIANARMIIKQLRARGLIQRINDTEVFFDIRRTTGELEGKGVDATDILMSEGVPSRIILGINPAGNIKSMIAFVHNDALREKLKQIISTMTAGGMEQIRDFVIWNKTDERI